MNILNEKNNNGFIYKTAKSFENAGIRHMFTTRYGGVSKNEFSSMNLGLTRGDDREKVLKNFSVAADGLSASLENFVLSTQLHEDKIICVSENDRGTGILKPSFSSADGLITDRKDVVLCVFTADCVPVLLYDKQNKAIGAVHSGWRGTAAAIVIKAVEKMNQCFNSKPQDIICAIGPCIGKCHFEIGKEVADILKSIDFCHDYVYESESSFCADLSQMNISALNKAGIPTENITKSDECTFCNSEKYFSHRATGGKRGNMAAIITL